MFWAWRAQIFEGNASCAKAVSLIQAWARANGLSGPSGDTGGYCQARCRIGSEFLAGVHARILRHLGAAVRPSDLWRGHFLKAIDGSSVQLADTTANQRAYPQPLGQKSGCGFPTMGIVGVLNLCLGGWDGFETCPHTAHDSAVAPRLLKHVGDGDILLGDRAFCSFELIARSGKKGAHAVMRLHQARHAKLDWRRGKKLSAIERLVVWKKPRHQPAGSTMDAQAWQALPEELILRYIKHGYEDRCGTKPMLVVVTTLLDGVKYDALDVATLYARRWDIELKLRDVKTTLGMERYDVRTPEMAARTLWMMTIGCNLLRSLMQRAAIEAGKPVAHMSFKGILDHAVASYGSYLAHRGKPRCLAVHHAPRGGSLCREAHRHPARPARITGDQKAAQGLSVAHPAPQSLPRNLSPRSSSLGSVVAKLRAIRSCPLMDPIIVMHPIIVTNSRCRRMPSDRPRPVSIY